MLASCVVAFDHVRRTMSVIGAGRRGASACWRRWQRRPRTSAGRAARGRRAASTRPAASATWRRSAEAKEHIAAGDAFQILMSQRVRRRTERLALRHLPRAAGRQPVALHVPARPAAATSWSARRRRRTCGSTWTAPASCGRSPAPGRAAPTAAEDDRAGRGADGLAQGAGRARDAGRPRPQRPVAGLRAGLRAGRALHGGRALLARDAHRLAGVRADPARPRRRRAAAGDLPRRDDVRRAQGAGDADHRRAGGPPPRRLRRRGRLPRVRRRHGHLHRDPHDRHARRDRLSAGGRAGSWQTPTRRRSTTSAPTRWRRCRRAIDQAETGIYGP